MLRLKLVYDSWSRVFFILAILTTLLQIIILYLKINDLPPQVPLFYSLPWGEPRLTSPTLLWLLPGASLTTGVINFTGSQFLSEKILLRILGSTAFLISALALVTLVKIILLDLP